MFLKVLTTAFVLCGLAMLFAMPAVLGDRPDPAERVELARYGTRVLAYFALTCFAWIGSAVCAVLLARRARLEFLESQSENIKGLIEGTLKDHER